MAIDEDKVDESEEDIPEEEEEKEELKIREGEKDMDVYEEPGREEAVDEDEISPREEAFMEGEDVDTEEGVCEQCGRVLSDSPDEVKEEKVGESIHFFCSDRCALKYRRSHKEK
jgi:ssDNA-binding Zn-finger/Zn-ribbon topoisomerase 1